MPQRLVDLPGRLAPDPDQRVVRRQRGQEGRDDLGDRGLRGGQHQVPDHACGQVFRRVLELLGPGEELIGQRHEGTAGGGQRQTAAGPLEQRHADLVLELLQLPGHGGLSHPEPLRGGGDRPRIGHCQEILQPDQVHAEQA